MRCQVLSLRWPLTARIAAAMLPAAASWRNSHRRAGSQAEASDLIGHPDAEGASAAAALIAVAAKDAVGAKGFAFRAGLVESVQEAVANQHADGLAMRTGRLLELLGQSIPFSALL